VIAWAIFIAYRINSLPGPSSNHFAKNFAITICDIVTTQQRNPQIIFTLTYLKKILAVQMDFLLAK